MSFCRMMMLVCVYIQKYISCTCTIFINGLGGVPRWVGTLLPLKQTHIHATYIYFILRYKNFNVFNIITKYNTLLIMFFSSILQILNRYSGR